MDVYCTWILRVFVGCKTWIWTKVQMGRLEVTHSNCLRRTVGVKLTDRNRLETKLSTEIYLRPPRLLNLPLGTSNSHDPTAGFWMPGARGGEGMRTQALL
eukprot:366060-Chlamydomonas_euryale.AAC.3